MYYHELEELFSKLTDSDKFRLICRFILKLPSNQIATLENRRRNTITMNFQRIETKLKKVNNHDELIAALQELFFNN